MVELKTDDPLGAICSIRVAVQKPLISIQQHQRALIMAKLPVPERVQAVEYLIKKVLEYIDDHALEYLWGDWKHTECLKRKSAHAETP